MIRLITDKKLDQLVNERAAEKFAQQEKKRQNDVLQKQANIAMLQAQINPHFLYNALDCIRGQALTSNAPQIAEITQALSGYFRYSVSLREDIVSLRDELSNVRNYVLIQKYRFVNRFSLQIDVDEGDPALLCTALPKLTLQPLVENAVLHAFSSVLKKDALVLISARATGTHVSIHVVDNGLGMTRPVYKELCDSLLARKAADEKNRHGIALINVHRRISLLFGEEYGLSISSAENIGTDIEIHIPLSTPEKMRAVTS